MVTVLFSGRPLWVNREIDRSDAFVAAWLPGTEGKGITDVLFRHADGAHHRLPRPAVVLVAALGLPVRRQQGRRATITRCSPTDTA